MGVFFADTGPFTSQVSDAESSFGTYFPMIRHQLRMQLDVCAVAILIFAQEGFYIFELRAIQKTALTPLHQGLEEPSEQHADVFCIRIGDLIVTGY